MTGWKIPDVPAGEPSPGPPAGMPAPQQVPAFDHGNQLIPLAETPAQLTTAKIPGPGGELLAWTIRTPTTTLTVLLGGKNAKTWARQVTRDAEGMSEAGLVTGNGVVAK